MQVQCKAIAPASTEKKTRGPFNVSEATTFIAQKARLTHYVKKLVTKDATSKDEEVASESIIVVPKQPTLSIMFIVGEGMCMKNSMGTQCLSTKQGL